LRNWWINTKDENIINSEKKRIADFRSWLNLEDYIKQVVSKQSYLTTTGITPSSITKINDTNVTLTLGGTPLTALLQSVSLTLGWTGTLADARINSSAIWNAKEPGITAGTTLEYWRGDKTWQTFPTKISNFTNDSGYVTAATVGAGYQPLDIDLTTIAGLTATTDNFIVSVASAWASRTAAQVKTTLSLDNVTNESKATMFTNPVFTGTFAAASGTFTGTVTNYNSVATINNGIPSEVAAVNLTLQSAAIAATTIYTNGVTDCYYLIYWNATRTRIATTSSALGGFQIQYTNASDNVVKLFPSAAVTNITANAINTTATAIGGSFTIKSKASTAIQYIMGYTSVGATTMQYDLQITIIKL